VALHVPHLAHGPVSRASRQVLNTHPTVQCWGPLLNLLTGILVDDWNCRIYTLYAHLSTRKRYGASYLQIEIRRRLAISLVPKKSCRSVAKLLRAFDPQPARIQPRFSKTHAKGNCLALILSRSASFSTEIVPQVLKHPDLELVQRFSEMTACRRSM